MKFGIYKFILLFTTLTLANVNVSQASQGSKSNLTEGYFFAIKFAQNNYSSNVRTDISTGTHDNAVPTYTIISDPSFSSSNHSIGLSLSKSLRLNRFTFLDIPLISRQLNQVFLNYGIFYDHLNYNNFANNKYNLSINSRYGGHVGAGYDLTDRHSVYFNIGLASIDYEIDSRSIAYDNGDNGTENNRTLKPIMYVGYNYQISENLYTSLEYSRQKVDLESTTYSSTNGVERQTERYKFDTEIETLSINISHNF